MAAWLWNISIALLLVNFCFCKKPFYCRIRKPDCTSSKYERHPCCAQEETSVTPTTKSTTSTQASLLISSTESSASVPQSINNTELFEVLEAQPSQIEPIVVKELSKKATSSSDKYAPPFCRRLKFNCNNSKSSSHACCRYPLPPGSPTQGSSSFSTAATNRKKIPKSKETVQSKLTTSRGSLLRKPLHQLSGTKEKNNFDPKLSPVCRIIRCDRVPLHRCCKIINESTATLTTSSSSSTTTTTTTSTATTTFSPTTASTLKTSTISMKMTEKPEFYTEGSKEDKTVVYQNIQEDSAKFSVTFPSKIYADISSVTEAAELTSNLHKPSIVGSGRKSKRISQIIPRVLIKEILVPNQIVPRVAPACFRFDCIANPEDECCNQGVTHPATKRHTLEEDEEDLNKRYVDSRVTATITRILKSFSWL